MELSEYLKCCALGVVAGVAATVLAGFTLGGWMTSGRADQMAADMVRAELTAVLVPHCVDQAVNDPKFKDRLALMKTVDRHTRTKILIQAGWATLLPLTDPDLVIASACMDKLIADH